MNEEIFKIICWISTFIWSSHVPVLKPYNFEIKYLETFYGVFNILNYVVFSVTLSNFCIMGISPQKYVLIYFFTSYLFIGLDYCSQAGKSVAKLYFLHYNFVKDFRETLHFLQLGLLFFIFVISYFQNIFF